LKLQIFRYECVSSTQALARALFLVGKGEGTVVLAERQEQGRGRQGRRWISPPGGLYASFIVRNQEALSLRVGIAIAEALRQIGVNAVLKWPNDILVGENKIAGILIDVIEKWAIVGIGVNINKTPVSGATCVEEETGVQVPPEELLKLILDHFAQPSSQSAVLERYRALCNTIGRLVQVATGRNVIEGTVISVDAQGRLLVEEHGVCHTVSSGECCYVRTGRSA
jgi:BirA family biotin operon repressor/biotin-[acetyl-CoA-carboxylase] ligase